MLTSMTKLIVVFRHSVNAPKILTISQELENLELLFHFSKTYFVGCGFVKEVLKLMKLSATTSMLNAAELALSKGAISIYLPLYFVCISLATLFTVSRWTSESYSAELFTPPPPRSTVFGK
jgi:hypothetical protein